MFKLNLMTLSAHLLEHGVKLLTSFLGSFALLLPFSSTFGYFAIFGILLLVLRRLILWAAPFMARNIVATTVIINGLWEVIRDIVYVMQGVVLGIFDILNAAHRVVPFFPEIKAHAIMGKPKDFEDLSPTQIRRALNQIQKECPAYNSISAISGHITRQTLNQYVCPIVRAAKPLGWVGDATETIFSPFSYDATPFPGDRGHTKNTNCEGPDDQDVAWVCVALGAGYVVLEILIPLMIAGIVLYSTGGSLFRLLGDLLGITLWVATLGFHLILLVLSEI